MLNDHLGQLVKAVVVDSGNRGTGQGAQQRGNPLPPPLGVIEVIHVVSRSTAVTRKGVLTIVSVENFLDEQPFEKRMKFAREPLAFDDDDLKGTIQPHDDALVVTARINGFLVKKVMIDQGSEADVMYPDLFKGLRLKKEDLLKYDTPLVGFDGRVVIPQGQISLPINIEGKEVVATFIVVASFSPYTAILGRPWIHAMGAIPSTLHVKVKFCIEQGVAVVRGSQQVARQCLATTINWKNENAGHKETIEETSL